MRVYINDIVIYSKTEGDHFAHLRETLELIEAHGLKLKLKKSFFIVPEIVLIEHIVEKDGIRTDPEIICKI